MIVKAFRALRPSPDLVDRLPSPPYDVLDSNEARQQAQGNPQSFLHVIKPEIDLDPALSPYDDAVYARARENFELFCEQGWLLRDERAAYYLYRLDWRGSSQIGVIGAAAVADYEQGRIKRHEFTRPAKENDRVRLNDAIGAHPGPVFLAYRPFEALDALIDRHAAGDPDVDIEADGAASEHADAADRVRHRLWCIDDPETVAAFESAFAELPASYVADGHHRSAAAARIGAMRRERHGDDPEAAWNYFLAVHFRSDRLRVLDYNRVVRDLDGLDAAAFLKALAAAGFEVSAGHEERRPPRRGCFGMRLDGEWYLLTPRAELTATSDDPVAALDVALLSRAILEPILGVGDPRTDPRIDFVGGIRGMDELERRVDRDGWAVAFALWPTSLDEVMAVADAGEVMPPKSTWFEPKLRSGLVVQRFDADDGL